MKCGLQWLGLVVALCGSTAGTFAAGVQTQQPTYSFDLPAQSLGVSLREIGQLTSTNILFDSQAVVNMVAPAVHARLTVSQVIARLLKGTKLGAKQYTADTILVGRLSEIQRKSAPRTGAAPTERGNGAHLSQAGGDPPVGTAEDASQQPPSDTNRSVLQEIIVTAQKYAQAAYNVPIALTVVGAGTLNRLGVTNLESLQYEVPGLYVESDGLQRRIYLGGVANISGTGALVSEYLDDVDVTSSPDLFAYTSLDLRTYDLSRVEVLRGPQGTLYGEGAIGGAIHYVTNSPVLDSYQFGLRGAMLFTKGGAPSQSLFPVVNIPLVANELGIRIAGEYSHEGGWIDEPSAQQKNLNSADLADTRIQALWRPSAQLKLSLMEIIHRKSYGLNVGAGQGGASGDNYAPQFSLPVFPQEQDQYNVSNMTVEYQLLGWANLINSATYVGDENYVHNESYPPYAGFDYSYIYPISHYRDSSVGDEFRLTNAGVSPSSPWEWTVGIFYKHVVNSSYPTDICFAPPSTVFTTATPSGLVAACSAAPGGSVSYLGQNFGSKAYSEFADVNYKIRRLTVGAGVRDFRDEEHHLAVGAVPQTSTFTSTDPRFYLVYGVQKHANVYLSAAKGFRSGGFNYAGAPNFEPESLWYYDLGIKTHGLKSFDATADVYYGDYSNYQIPVVSPEYFSITLNAGTVHLKGGNAAVEWHPGNNWRVGLSGEYVDARVVSLGGYTGAPESVGQQLDLTTPYQINGLIAKNFRLAGRMWYLTAEYSQRAGQKAHNFGAEAPPTSAGTIYMLNLAGGVLWNDNLEMGFTVRNVLNDRPYLAPYYVFGGTAKEAPVTAGLYFDAKF